MNRYLVQEEYREDVKGVRVVLVEAESKEAVIEDGEYEVLDICLLYTSPSPRDYAASRMPSSA